MTYDIDVLFVGDDSASNSLGRTYCLWLLASSLGMSTATVTATGASIWTPVAGTDFATSVFTMRGKDLQSLPRPRIVMCVKPLPSSLRLATSISRHFRVELVLDIDDPDIEAGMADSDPLRRAAKFVLRPRTMWWFLWARRNAPSMRTTVSNGYLYDRYGGVIIPHVRPPLTPGRQPTRDPARIAFVGTARGHKGVDLLREAVRRVGGYELLITDDQPDDARAHERWVGRTTMEEGLALVADSDLVVIPSRDTPFSRGQLPAKLVDAMILGRPVVASDLPAIRWALGDAGEYFTPGSVDSLAAALVKVKDVGVRLSMSMKSADRGRQMFIVESQRHNFALAVEGGMPT